MEIHSKSFGLTVAFVAAWLWSFYSLGSLILDIVIITLIDGTIYSNLSNLSWANHSNEYLAQVILIASITGMLGWLVAEIYNDINQMFSLKLK